MKRWWSKLFNRKAESMQEYILSQKQKGKVFGEYVVDISKRPVCSLGRCIKESGRVVNQEQLDDYKRYSKIYNEELKN